LFTADISKAYVIKHDAITLITQTRAEFTEAYKKQTSQIVTIEKPSLIV
jgi:predicted nucleic-acid-binding Zn-ribbon protein